MNEDDTLLGLFGVKRAPTKPWRAKPSIPTGKAQGRVPATPSPPSEDDSLLSSFGVEKSYPSLKPTKGTPSTTSVAQLAAATENTGKPLVSKEGEWQGTQEPKPQDTWYGPLARGAQDVMDTTGHMAVNAVAGGLNMAGMMPAGQQAAIDQFNKQYETGTLAPKIPGTLSVSDYAAAHADDPHAFDLPIPTPWGDVHVAPTWSDLGRGGGQVAASAPLMMAGAGTGALVKALPIVGKVAAPVVDFALGRGGSGVISGTASKAAASSLAGAGGAGMVDAADPTTSQLDKMKIGGLTGLATAAVAAPVAALVTRWWKGPLPVKASVESLSDTLDAAGLTPAQARAAIKAGGPDTTLLDIHPAIAKEGAGVAAESPEAANLLTSKAVEDKDLATAFDPHLGPKPDLPQTLDKLNTDASSAYDQLSTVAKNIDQTGQAPLSVAPTVKAIENLKKGGSNLAKGELAKVQRDLVDPGATKMAAKTVAAGGTPKVIYKNKLQDLLSARRTLDDTIKKFESSKTVSPDTLNRLRTARAELNKQIHANPAQAQADKLYSDKSSFVRAADTGQTAFSKTTTAAELRQLMDGATDAEKEAIRLGARPSAEGAVRKALRGDPEAITEMQDKLTVLYGKDTADKLWAQTQALVAKRGNRAVVQKGAESGAVSKVRQRAKGGTTSGHIMEGLKDMAYGAVAALATGQAPHLGAIAGLATVPIVRAIGNAVDSKAANRFATDFAKLVSASGKNAEDVLDAVVKYRAQQGSTAPKLRDLLATGAGIAESGRTKQLPPPRGRETPRMAGR